MAVFLAAQAAAAGRAEELLPTQNGESGYLNTPVAESLGKTGAAFSLSLRAMRSEDVGRSIGPSPFTMSFGLGRGEAGFSLRQGGLPGDPRPATTVAALAGKFSVLGPRGHWPECAVDLFVDRINQVPAVHLRAIATSERIWRMRLTGVGGYVLDTERSSGWTAGAAISFLGPWRTDLAAEILRFPAGLLTGAEVRFRAFSTFAVGLGGGYLPSDAKTYLAAIRFVFINPPPHQPAKATEGEKVQEEVAKPKSSKKVFRSDRPRFPLELRMRPLPGTEGGPAPHYPTGGVAVAPPAPEPSPAPEPAKTPESPPAPETPSAAEPAKAAEPPSFSAQPVAPDASHALEPPPAEEKAAALDAGAAPDAATSPGIRASELKPEPAREERGVPPPPALKEGAGGKEQLRVAIAAFQPAIKECVNRALKRDSGLRGEARLKLEIKPNGTVTLAELKSKTLAGGWFEQCLRQAADALRMPRATEGYNLEIPIKIHVADGGGR